MSNPQILEAIQRNEIQAYLMKMGWMVYNPAADVGGVDWIAINLSTNELRKIQQKSRFLINKKYIGKDLWIGTAAYGAIYMIPHDKLLETSAGLKAQRTKSWRENGEYHWPSISEAMKKEVQGYAID